MWFDTKYVCVYFFITSRNTFFIPINHSMNKSLPKTMKLDQMFSRQMCENLFVLGRNFF